MSIEKKKKKTIFETSLKHQSEILMLTSSIYYQTHFKSKQTAINEEIKLQV